MKNAKFKDSGVQWLGEIPQHWEIRKLKFVFKETSIKNRGNMIQLAATQSNGVVPKDTLIYKSVQAVTSDLNSFKFVKKNNFVISLRSFEGGIEHSNFEGIISPAYTILENIIKINFEYFKFLLKSNTFISNLKQYKTGIREGQNISYLELQNDFLPLPPLDEQGRIAEFLDKKCEKIAEFIDKKQQIISLLKEQKLALINESTCGRIHTHNGNQTQSKISPLPCGGGLGVGIKTDKSSKDFTPPLAPPAGGGEQESGNSTRGGEQEVSHRPLAPYMKEFSRAMRKNPTQAENKLWQELRGKKLGFGFRRQFVIDSKYIADFVCLEKRLIIECDGGQHNKYESPHPKSLPQGEGLSLNSTHCEAKSKSPLPCESDSKISPLPQHEGRLGVGNDMLNHPDIQRDFYLESQNFRILRFWNNEILGNLEGVLCVIKEALESNGDFANVKYTCESTHPLAPSAREGEQENCPRVREGECVESPRAFTFKHSGIEWLGEIPQHWEVRKLKQIANFDKGLNITKENLKDNGIFVLSYGEIHSKYPFEVNPQIHQLKCVDENYLNTNLNSLLRKGDFVFADTSEDIIGSGNFSFLNSEIPTFAGYHTIICRIHNVDCHESANADSRDDKHSTPSLRVSEANAAIHKINAKFLAYEFESSIFRSQIQKNVNGVKVYSITQNILKDCAVWLPPLDEQRRIAEFLDKKCEKIDKAIALIEQEIQAIKKYKTSLIDKAVRGGINV